MIAENRDQALLEFDGSSLLIYKDQSPRESTLSESIDDLLHGGIPLHAATEVYGSAGSGKSQFCFQLCAAFSSRGLWVLYFDPSRDFRPERIQEIAFERGLPLHLELIHVSIPETPEKLVESLEQLKGRSNNDGQEYGLVIIDSIADVFLRVTEESEKEVVSRQQKLAVAVQTILTFALKKQIPMVFTNQVRTRDIDSNPKLVEFGGNVLSQMVHNRIFLRRVGQNVFATVSLLTGEEHTRQVFIETSGIR